MDFSTLRPVSYAIDQPQITPMFKRVSDAMTLADLMDKRKAAKALQKQAQDEYNKRLSAQAAFSGAREPEAPVFSEPVTPAPMEPVQDKPINFNIPETPITGTMPEAEVTPAMPSMSLSRSGLMNELQQRTANEMGIPAPVPRTPRPQAQVQPYGATTPTPESWDVAHQQNLQQIGYLDELEKYNKLKERATGVPPEYAWMEPAEYDKYLSRSAISPEFGESYLDRIVKTRESLAGTQEKKAKTQNIESKLGEMEDLAIGNYLEKLPWAEMTPEQINSVANDLVASNISPYKALQAVQNPDFYINKAVSSPARQAIALKQQELERKKAEDQARLDKEAKDREIQERKLRMDQANKDRDYKLDMEKFNITKEQAKEKEKVKSDALYEQYQQALKLKESGGIDKYLGPGFVKEMERGGRAFLGDKGFSNFNVLFKAYVNQQALKTLATQPGVKTDQDFKVARESTTLDASSAEATKEKLDAYINWYENNYLNKTPTSAPVPRGPAIKTQADQEAIDWAKQNRGDPRAQAILKMHGVK